MSDSKKKVWVETANGGFWSIEKNRGANMKKLPLFCPRDECRRVTGTLDDEYMRKYGVCKLCYIMFVEDRKEPLIDTEFYRKRLEERGY